MEAKKKNHHLPLLLSLLSLLASCTQIIDIKHNDSVPQLVITGNVTDQAGPYTIKLAKSVNYTTDNVFPTVSGAVVIVRDDLGNSETLTESTPGNYTTSALQGVAGRTYSISVNSEGKTHNGQAKMPAAVEVNNLVILNESGMGEEGSKTIVVYYQDPVGISNYYRFIIYVNGVQQKNIFVAEDRYSDGILVKQQLTKDKLVSGDLIRVDLQTIDKKVYDYFIALQQMDEGNIFSPTPGNPLSNLSNNALGYFSACSVRSSLTVAVP